MIEACWSRQPDCLSAMLMTVHQGGLQASVFGPLLFITHTSVSEANVEKIEEVSRELKQAGRDKPDQATRMENCK